MNSYRVSFYKDVLNSDGHSFKCLQRQIDVQSDGPSRALALAERLIDNDRLNAECIEVTHIPSDHYEPGHPHGHSPAPAEHPEVPLLVGNEDHLHRAVPRASSAIF